MGLGEQPAQAGVALAVFAEQGKVVAALNLYLSADDGLDAARPSLLVKADGAGQPVVVRQGQGRHIEGRGSIEQTVQ